MLPETKGVIFTEDRWPEESHMTKPNLKERGKLCSLPMLERVRQITVNKSRYITDIIFFWTQVAPAWSFNKVEHVDWHLSWFFYIHEIIY